MQSINNKTLPTELIQLLTPEQAWYFRAIPINQVDGNVVIAIDEDQEHSKSQELNLVIEGSYVLQPTSKTEINHALSKYYRMQNAASENIESNEEMAMLQRVVKEAKLSKSSDIHIEPYETNCKVRYRVDGHLLEKFQLSRKDYQILLNQIKIKANLDIAEKRLPQDGRITIKEMGGIDLRVSILPTLKGEKIVLRLLTKDAQLLSLQQLGFNEHQLLQYRKAIYKENGIVLINGPVGSGKTTTLYATLQLLNQSNVNILTIEDPVEYTIDGIHQVHIKTGIGLDFAKALRAFLRQDPNIIMIGEIRDKETAEMAIRASLTGRLVFSTIHTNSAIGTITRLQDMGIAPYLIADTLNMSLAQRLVRKLCVHCKEKMTQEEIQSNHLLSGIVAKSGKEIFKASECVECHFTGYKGRTAIYEMLLVNEEISTYIRERKLIANRDKINLVPISQQAINLLLNGETSWSEIRAYINN